MTFTFKNNNIGWLEIICGPMFSGKSEELLRKINRLEYANIDYLIFIPSIDTRSSKTISSRNGVKRNAISIKSPLEIYDYILKQTIRPKVVAIDEVQFLDGEELLEVVDTLIKNGIIIYASGLDNDFRNVPFKTTALLLSKAEKIQKLSSICTICGSEATCTQRIIDGQPADFNQEVFKVGDFESYTARCLEHHQLPGNKLSSKSKSFYEKYKY